MQQTLTPQQAYPDDEISLLELWQIQAGGGERSGPLLRIPVNLDSHSG